MSVFVLSINVPDHEHSPRAYRHTLGTLLDAVKQCVGSTEDREGNITISPAPFTTKVIGFWKIIDEGCKQ